MPSHRRQINVRLDSETAERFNRLLRSLPRVLGTDLTQSQIVAMALKLLDAQYVNKSQNKS